LLATGGLIGFAYASQVLSKGSDPYRISCAGAAIGLPAFGIVILSVPLAMPELFLIGNFLIGFGGALFGHATLTATMNQAPVHSTGIALGAWGSVQATAAGLGIALSGVIRDVVNHVSDQEPALGYYVVYSIEFLLLVITIAVTVPLIQSLGKQNSVAHS
jgi:BCD family chlorophyll transporter-like MFS transporter